ncbi:MAG: YdcF family protein, partial [Deltaproteobacteria bacterium]|nr:YdcF family protein [Deltaproteobacteria bacterium]
AIIDIGHNVSSTYEEARAVREWAQQSGAKKIIFITEMFPSRRVRWIFDRQLAPLGVKVILRPYPGANFDFERWWQDQRGIAIFASETLKYLYYRLMY